MKKKSTSRFAPALRSLGEGGFFNLRVLIGFVFCLAGVFIALAGAGLYLGSSKAQAQPGSGSAATAQAQTGTQAPVFHPHQVTLWTPRTQPLPPLQAPLFPTIQLSTVAWTAIGPAPLNSLGPTENVSGRNTGIAAHPTDANIIYVAPAGGGVWKTTSGGTNWSPLTDIQSTLSMGAVAIARSNPLVVYAGTGEANNSGDSNFGRGILVSTDGGGTFTLNSGPGGVFNTDRMTCSRIAVDPTNANIAYAAMADFGINGIFTSGITGIYKTTNGGSTWTNVTMANGKDSTYPWSDVVVDANTTSIVYAAVGWPFGTANNGVYKSTNSGATWTDVSHTGVVVQPHVYHDGIDFDANGKLLDGDDGGIYRLDDPTVPSWTDLNGDLNTIQFQGIGLHPTNANIVIGGSQDNGTELYRGAPLWTETAGGDGGLAQFSH